MTENELGLLRAYATGNKFVLSGRDKATETRLIKKGCLKRIGAFHVEITDYGRERIAAYEKNPLSFIERVVVSLHTDSP